MPRNSGHLKCIYSLTHRRIWVRRLAGGVCEVCRRGFGRTRRARVRGSGDGKVVRHFSARGPRQAPTRAIRCRSPHAGKGCPGTRGIWSVYAHLLIDVYGCDDLLAACARCGGEVSAGPEGHVSRGSGDGKVVRHFSARGAPPASTRAIRCTSPAHAGRCPETRGILECIYSLTHRRIWVRRLVPTLAACARCTGEVSAGPEGHVSGGAVTGRS